MHTKKPNIVFILSDQHSASTIGAMGNSDIDTPNLDKLYEDSTHFENCYCNSPLCVPSRSSMLTGQYPVHTGVYNNQQSLSYSQPTFVHSLGAGGYETVLSGRMHFKGYDQRHGYEKRFVGDLTPTHAGIDNQQMVYGSLMRTSDQSMNSIKKSGGGWSTVLDYDNAVFDAASDYIEKRTDNRPLFLTVGLYGPHCPFVAPVELFEWYYNRLPALDISDEYRRNIHPAVQLWYKNRGVERVGAEDMRRVKAAYYGVVTYLDGLVGRFLQILEKTLDMKNTLVIYGSDHGESLGEHGLFWKSNFYEGASKVPLAFRWDGQIERDRGIRELTSLVDLAPTLLDIAGAERLPRQDGQSLGDALFGRSSIDERDVLSYCSDLKGDPPSAMVRKGDFKLIAYAGYSEVQLFDLRSDPKETNDLGSDPSYTHIIDDLRKSLGVRWNENDAQRELEACKKEFSILKAWAEAIDPVPIEEWYGDPERNYISHYTSSP